jgi:hypothetical protein
MFWCVIYAIAGLWVLAGVPALRVTLFNLIAFVIGAFAGSAASLSLYGRYRGRFDNYPDAISFIGAMAVGTLLVVLKLRFVKTQSHSRFL